MLARIEHRSQQYAPQSDLSSDCGYIIQFGGSIAFNERRARGDLSPHHILPLNAWTCEIDHSLDQTIADLPRSGTRARPVGGAQPPPSGYLN